MKNDFSNIFCFLLFLFFFIGFLCDRVAGVTYFNLKIRLGPSNLIIEIGDAGHANEEESNQREGIDKAREARSGSLLAYGLNFDRT